MRAKSPAKFIACNIKQQTNKKKTVNLIDLLLTFIGVVGDKTKQITYYDDGGADDDDRH